MNVTINYAPCVATIDSRPTTKPSDEFLRAMRETPIGIDEPYSHRIFTAEATTALVLSVLCILVLRRVARRETPLVIATAVLIAMVLFPPFTFHAPNGYATSEGYGFILDPPQKLIGVEKYGTSVNTPLLLTQILVVFAVGGVGYWITSRRSREET